MRPTSAPVPLLLVVLVSTARAFTAGPPDAFTGAPGQGTCVQCHNSYPLNSGDGTFSILGPPTFAPGRTYPVVVQLSDPGQAKWGFEFSPLDKGTCTLVDTVTTQVSVTGSYVYVKHRAAGTFPGTPGPVSWTFQWTAPANPPDTVFFYAAGNAANNDNSRLGDYVYTAVAFAVLDTVPPNPVGTLQIQPQGGDLVLTWSDPGDNVGVVGYLIHLSPFPYLDETAPVLDWVSSPGYVFPGGVGNPSVHHFFLVRATDSAGNAGPPSARVGEFEHLMLVP